MRPVGYELYESLNYTPEVISKMIWFRGEADITKADSL